MGGSFRVRELVGAGSISDAPADGTSLQSFLSDVISSSLVAGGGIGAPAARWRYEDQTQLLCAMQVAAMMPAPHVPYAPWRISDENLYARLKNTLLFRASLSDYMSRTARESNRTAEPIVRHMEYQFPRQRVRRLRRPVHAGGQIPRRSAAGRQPATHGASAERSVDGHERQAIQGTAGDKCTRFGRTYDMFRITNQITTWTINFH